jgi:hypothetical protein
MEGVTGELGEIAKYGGPIEFIMKALVGVVEKMGRLDKSTLQELEKLFGTISRRTYSSGGSEWTGVDYGD